MKTNLHYCLLLFFFLTCFSTPAKSQTGKGIVVTKKDSSKIKYPFQDQPFLDLEKRYQPVHLNNPSNIRREIIYDTQSQQYIIREKLGSKQYRPPTYLSLAEYRKYESKQQMKNYWEHLADKNINEERQRRLFPVINVESPTFSKIFGGNSIDINPRGSADVSLVGMLNKNENPLFNETQRKQWGFDFNQNINLNLTGKIGELVDINANFNSKAQFDFENQIKFDYKPKDDHILRRLEIGNVNLPLNSTLIQGSEALFGVKAQLQFGKLNVTGIVSQKRSRQKTMTVSNGGTDNNFEISADNYEANQHYFLGQYFRDNFNKTLALAPVLNTNINILQVEVWVSNTSNSYTDARDIMALMDLGEYSPNNSAILPESSKLPSTGIPGQSSSSISNNLLQQLGENGRLTNGNFTQNFFAASGGNDNYAKITYARKLREGTEYTINHKLGFISLLYPLNNAEILSVAYRYTANGREYQVGEFSTDIPVSPSNPSMLYTKLLKNETLKTNLPTWNLMMKNIYSLGSYSISDNNFKLQIYRTTSENASQQLTMFEGSNTQNKLWLQILGLDRLNPQQALQPDGFFDYITDITIEPKRGRIMFPYVEPFGTDLIKQFNSSTEQELIDKYAFPELYSSTKIDAQQNFPNKNRYIIKGSYSSSIGTEYSLGAMNIPRGSVKVNVGGALLQEGSDYTIDYEIGKLRILNQALVMSGQQVNISLEDNSMFNLQQKTMVGARFDYKANERLQFGATYLNLTEKPLTEKVAIGNEPISNTILGADITYNAPSRWLTRMVDKLPFLSTKEESSISFYSEFAKLIPGHPSGLNTADGSTGTTYIDDFENSVSYVDLKGSYNWQIAGTPHMFAESQLSNDLKYGYNRSLFALYNIDNIFYQLSSDLKPSNIKLEDIIDHRVRPVTVQEVFPAKQSATGYQNEPLSTIDLAFYPKLRGPYNYNTTNVNADGTLNNPKSRWGGMFRKIDNPDFEAQNIEFIEIWMMDPKLTNPNKENGDIYFNLGNISEDILKDGRKSLENALSPTGDLSLTDETAWGRVSKMQPTIQAFDNDPDNRTRQDVGLDGLSDLDESSFHTSFINQLQGILSGEAFEKLKTDPSSDNFVYYRGDELERANAKILDRYKYHNGIDGNSKTNQQSQNSIGVGTASNTLLPDGEDVNRDNNMNEIDEYYQYKISLRPQDLLVGQNHIVEEQNSQIVLQNGQKKDVTWYKFRIPITNYESKVGNINDFKNIRFVRMFTTNFADTAIVRMAKLQLIRGEWRRYNSENNAQKVIADYSMGMVASDNSTFNVANISIEENSTRSPIPYVVPPGINRQVDWSNNNNNIQLNEQALSIDIFNLKDGYGRATYKTASHDFRPYGKLEVFVHAEGEFLRDADAHAFIRIGTDDLYNYYEYDSPLAVTPYGTVSADIIWPEQNRLSIRIKALTEAKQARDKASYKGQPWPIDIPFEYSDGVNKITIVGSPDISKVRYYMMGIRNPLKGSSSNSTTDDARAISGSFWFNELRLTDFDNKGGWAATARLDLKLADFANVSLTGSKSTIGFGYLEQRLNERQRSDKTFFSVVTNAELGKFFPKKHGIVIPFYFSYSNEKATPEYNPLNPDIELNSALANMARNEQDSLIRLVQNFTARKSFSFTNIRKIRMDNENPIRPWNIENFSLSYAYSEYNHRDYTTKTALQKNYRGAIDYNFSTGNPKFIEPLKNVIKSKYLSLLKDFNFNLLPSLINFRLDVNRIYNENSLRDNSSDNYLPTLYNKNFTLNRIYGLSWDLTKSLRLDFNATNYSIIDEPAGRIDGIARDTMWTNFWKMGRTSDYNHMLNITYTIPIHKVPGFDWVNIITRYGAQFNWNSAPLMSIGNPDLNIGNDIQNNRTIQVNPTANLLNLYNKFAFIRNHTGRNAKGPASYFFQLLTMIRKVDMAYTKNEGMFLPGYLPKTNMFGYDFDQNAPGWGFLLGSQSDISQKAMANGWITTDTMQNQLFTKTFAENLSFRANAEPIKGLNIDFTAVRVDNKNYSATIQYDHISSSFQTLLPYTTGNYNITQIALKTSFKDHATLFQDLEKNRQILSLRLAENNLNSVGLDKNGYADGYGKNQQDVVVNAFLATYLGKDPNKISTKSLPRIPLPNWRLTYNGLAKLPLFSDFLTSLNISHSYNSQYAISGYNSVDRYNEEFGGPSERDVNNNFIAKNQYQQISIVDQFIPLIGLDARFKNNLTANSEFRKSRILNYSLNNSQLSLMSEESIILGIGYRKNGVKLPFGLLEDRKTKNDLNFRMDLAINDRKTMVYRADVNSSEVSAGNKSISFNPSLDYMINQLINVRFYLNTNSVKPYTSQTYNTSYTNFGINIRVMFQ